MKLLCPITCLYQINTGFNANRVKQQSYVFLPCRIGVCTRLGTMYRRNYERNSLGPNITQDQRHGIGFKANTHLTLIIQ